MPCYDPPAVGKEEALLCGIVRVLNDTGSLSSMLDAVDWKEIGLRKEDFYYWFHEHVSHDRILKYGDVK